MIYDRVHQILMEHPRALQSDWLQISRQRSVRTWASPPTAPRLGDTTHRGERCWNTPNEGKSRLFMDEERCLGMLLNISK